MFIYIKSQPLPKKPRVFSEIWCIFISLQNASFICWFIISFKPLWSGLCPCTPLGAQPPDLQYRLALAMNSASPIPNSWIRSCWYTSACMGTAYLADELGPSSDFENRRRLRSASSLYLIVRRSRLSTHGDRAFSVADSRLWIILPPHVKSNLRRQLIFLKLV